MRFLVGVALLAMALSGLAVHTARCDLAPEMAVLIGTVLHVPEGQVRVRRALLHPLGELRLYGVEVNAPALRAKVAEVRVEFDPLPALVMARARPQVRQVTGAGLALTLLGRRLSAGQAVLSLRGPGRSRVVLHGVEVADAQLRIEHLGLELHGTAPQRVAMSGVRLHHMGGIDVIAVHGDKGWVLRAALRGGQVVAAAAPGQVEVDLDLAHLALPLPLTPALDLTDARMSGQLHVVARADVPGPGPGPLSQPGTLTASGHLLLDELAIRHPLLAAGAVSGFHAGLAGQATLSRGPGQWRFSTPGLSLSLMELRLSLSGDMQAQGDRYRADVELVLDELDCGQALKSLPPRLLPKLEGLGLSGQLGGVLRLSVDSRTLPDVDLESAVDIGCRVVSDPPQADAHALLDPHLSIERPGEDGQPRRLPLGLLADGEGFVPLHRLPRPVVRAFLVAEDNQFFQHRGFDIQMMVRALGLDLKEQQTLKGASTITQQVAKNLWLSQERALGRKLEEAVLAWRMEQVVPKERLLEIYLNLAELGSGIYGVSMAAQHYFGATADQLTLDQGIQLAALLPAPRRGMDGAWATRYRDILKRYKKARVPAATPQ